MNPHARQPTSIASLFHSLWIHRQLIWQLTKREIIGRYRGSALGLLWSFLNPVFMLAVYTFFFAVVLKARWGESGTDESKAEYAVILFAGMIVYALFAEVINRAPTLIINNANYVKKVIFPLEILPVVSLGTALFHALISLLVMLLAYILVHGSLHWTLLFLPLILLPYCLLILGFSWVLSSMGVYMRDLGQTIPVLTQVAMFLSPVFYSVNKVPEEFRPYILANPITFIIEQTRDVLIWGKMPNFTGLGLYAVASFIVAWLGYAWFQKTRKGFADVL